MHIQWIGKVQSSQILFDLYSADLQQKLKRERVRERGVGGDRNTHADT